jgi:hypothetical protein
MISVDQPDVMDITDLSDVIDWDEAMEQCGGDEEFLLELLGDLQEEFNTQIRKIEVAMVSSRSRLLSSRSSRYAWYDHSDSNHCSNVVRCLERVNSSNGLHQSPSRYYRIPSYC